MSRNTHIVLITANGESIKHFYNCFPDWIVWNNKPFKRGDLAVSHSDADIKKLGISEDDAPMTMVYVECSMSRYIYERNRVIDQIQRLKTELENMPEITSHV